MTNVLHYNIGRDGDKQTAHPTEKPENLIGKLIEVFTNPGDIVLDTFAGGGTTGAAAFKRNRHCISMERETNFIQMIKDRQRKSVRARR